MGNVATPYCEAGDMVDQEQVIGDLPDLGGARCILADVDDYLQQFLCSDIIGKNIYSYSSPASAEEVREGRLGAPR